MIFKTSLFCILFFSSLLSLSIEEQKTRVEQEETDLAFNLQMLLHKTNIQIKEKRESLHQLFVEGNLLFLEGSSEEKYANVLSKMREVRRDLAHLEEEWRKSATTEDVDEYGLWLYPEGSVEQLIIDFGGLNYLYIIPNELGSLPINVVTHMPIPRELWDDMIALILSQNGIGIKQITPIVRSLFIENKGGDALSYVTNDKSVLETFPSDSKALFLLNTGKLDPQAAYYFLQKLNSVEQFDIFPFKNDLILIGNVRALLETLKVFEFVKQQYRDKKYKVLSLKKTDAISMKLMLETLWKEDELSTGFEVLIFEKFSNTLFLLGSEEQIIRAEEVVADIERQVEYGRDNIVYWYSVKYSDPYEVAHTLSRVYSFFLKKEGKNVSSKEFRSKEIKDSKDSGDLLITPPSIDFSEKEVESAKEGSFDSEHFVVDPKTGAIIMVVEENILPKLKQLLKRIDVPKKMVRIDVLLFEKHTVDENRFGLNFLKVGTASSDTDHTNLRYNSVESRGGYTDTLRANDGLLSFILGRTTHGSMPSFDLAYNFLLAQENIQINANPSVVAINQTPAVINLMDEISLNTGTDIIPTSGEPVYRNSFERKQYGIRIQITPIIHLSIDDESGMLEESSITLKTTILFDTPKSDKNNRPKIFRRQIRNEVRVLDGETVILGGLQRKDQVDTKESLPFIGELPGIGKFFSETSLRDESVQMFIFITPTIIGDSKEELEKARQVELRKRPGDIPEFLNYLESAKEDDKRKEFEFGLFKILKT